MYLHYTYPVQLKYFFNQAKTWRSILYWFACFIQIVDLKLFCQFSKSNKKNNIHFLCKTHKSIKNQLPKFGLVEEFMDLVRIILAVSNIYLYHPWTTHAFTSTSNPKFVGTTETYFVWPIFSDLFDLFLHWVSLVHGINHYINSPATL